MFVLCLLKIGMGHVQRVFHFLQLQVWIIDLNKHLDRITLMRNINSRNTNFIFTKKIQMENDKTDQRVKKVQPIARMKQTQPQSRKITYQ